MRKLHYSVPRDLKPTLQYENRHSRRAIKLPDGAEMRMTLHNKYWAMLDKMCFDGPGVDYDIIQSAWDQACVYADGHPYDYLYDIFEWTFPFEITDFFAISGALEHNASNDFINGIYEVFETFLNQYNWPTPLTYRRLITDPRIRPEV